MAYKKPKISIIQKDKSLSSHVIKVEAEKGISIIPVVDVRDGKEARERAARMIKGSQQSKYLKPSYGAGGGCYQVSHKR